MGIAAAMDDFGVWEEAGDEGDIEGVVGLLVGDEAFFGDFGVVGGGGLGDGVDYALVVDEAGDWEGLGSPGAWY